MASQWQPLLFETCEAGVSSAVTPELLPPNQNAWMLNGQNRGGKPSTRPNFEHCIDLPTGLIQGGESFSIQGGMLVVSIAGLLYRIRINGKNFSYEVIDTEFVNSPVIKQVWMTQTVETLVIQDHQSAPILYNGSTGRRAELGEVPRGRMMAYGNGRLWVAVNANELVAGDIRTKTPGSELNFTEITYLNGGGRLFLPQAITALSFIPVTGQSDYGALLAFSGDETKAFRADITRRDDWGKAPGFVTDIMRSVGAASQWSIASVNQDLYWRDSNSGIRSIRNALADEAGPGSSPVSREVSRLTEFDSQRQLAFCSSVYHQNRLLMTCSPFLMLNGGVGFKNLIALDFAPLSTMGGKSQAAFDGQWSGLNFVKLISGKFRGQNRAFALTTDRVGNNQLWEFGTGKRNDFSSDCDTGAKREQPIKCLVEYPMRDFGAPKNRKRLERCDIWLSQLDGPLDLKVYWRADNSVKWRLWDEAETCAKTTDPEEFDPHVWKNLVAQERPQFKTFTIPDEINDVVRYAASVGFEFQVRLVWTGHVRIHRMMVYGTMLEDPDYVDRAGFEAACVQQSVSGNEVIYEIQGCPGFESDLPCGLIWDFGLVETRTGKTYRITNDGEGDLILGTITVTGAGFSVDQPLDPVVIPGGHVDIVIYFDPAQGEESGSSGHIIIPSNYADSPCEFDLYAQGQPSIIFEQYDGPFVFPPAFQNVDGTRFYRFQSAVGDNGVKFAAIPNNPNRAPCLVTGSGDPNISARGVSITQWGGLITYDLITNEITGYINVTGNLSGELPGPGSNAPAAPDFVIQAQSIDAAYAGLTMKGAAFLAEREYGTQFQDSFQRTFISGNQARDAGYFIAGFMGAIWCGGYALSIDSTGPIYVSDLGYTVARTGEPARTQQITGHDTVTRTFTGTKSRALITVQMASTQDYLSGNYVFLVTPDVGDPYYYYLSDEHEDVVPGEPYTVTLEYPMIVGASVRLESYSFYRFRQVSDNFQSYADNTDYDFIAGISTWGSASAPASPVTNCDAWDAFEVNAPDTSDNVLVVQTGYAWAAGGETNAVSYEEVFDTFEAYPVGESFTFLQGVGWNGLGQANSEFLFYASDAFETYADGTIFSLDGGESYYWAGNGQFS